MKVAVIMGGMSSEREVSLRTGEEMVKGLDRNKYEVVPIVMDCKKDLLNKLHDIDFALIALHGKFGEDGTIQALLESLNIPYSGCGVLSSALCMNKNLTKKLLKAEGLPTAPWTTVKSVEDLDLDKIKDEIGYPVFVKPNSGGSSVATFLVKDEVKLKKTVQEVLKYDEEVMIEQYINGDECTSFVLNGQVYPTVAISSTNGEFFDYAAKYFENGAKEEVVELPKDLQDRIDDVSRKCWKTFDCKVYVRLDIIVKEGVPYVLELNTLPGMTKTSLIPKSAKARGMEFSELLDKIIEYSLMAFKK